MTWLDDWKWLGLLLLVGVIGGLYRLVRRFDIRAEVEAVDEEAITEAARRRLALGQVSETWRREDDRRQKGGGQENVTVRLPYRNALRDTARWTERKR